MVQLPGYSMQSSTFFQQDVQLIPMDLFGVPGVFAACTAYLQVQSYQPVAKPPLTAARRPRVWKVCLA